MGWGNCFDFTLRLNFKKLTGAEVCKESSDVLVYPIHLLDITPEYIGINNILHIMVGLLGNYLLTWQ